MTSHDQRTASSAGTLYLVSTPIGNLEDITIRALKVLRRVDLIACEDTRKTLKLLNRYKIRKPLTSYFSANQMYKGAKIIRILLDGKDVALVSEAGTPGISDPGTSLVKEAVSQGIKVVPIGGISAAVTALSSSGFDTSKFVFIGFLPRKKGKRIKILSELKERSETIIIYESPYRLLELLKELKEVFGNRAIAICRELTKIHEEILRDRLDYFISFYSSSKVLGEVTIIINGCNDSESSEPDDANPPMPPV